MVTVEAEDTDSGANGVVRYSIVSGDVGVLDLDREPLQLFTLICLKAAAPASGIARPSSL